MNLSLQWNKCKHFYENVINISVFSHQNYFEGNESITSAYNSVP